MSDPKDTLPRPNTGDDLAVVMRAIRPLDCGAHHCRYCPAGSNNQWQHTEYCIYDQSVKEVEEARRIVSDLRVQLAIGSAPDALRDARAPVPSAEPAKEENIDHIPIGPGSGYDDEEDSGVELIHQAIPDMAGTEPRPNFSDYWQCRGCGAVLSSPTTGLAILNCWNCHKQDWRPIAKPGLTPYQAWCEIRKDATKGWPDSEIAAADIAVTRVTARLAQQAGSAPDALREASASPGRSAAPKSSSQSVDRSFRDQVIQAVTRPRERLYDHLRVAGEPPDADYAHDVDTLINAAARCALTQARERIKQTGSVDNGYWVLDALIAALTP